MRLPAALLRHRVAVEPYLGSTANGPRYGPRSLLPAYVETGTTSRRTPEGRVVVSVTKVWVQLNHQVTPEARVFVEGRPVEVVSVDHLEARIGTPDHTLITCQ